MKKRSLSFIGVICLFMLVGCSFGSGSLKVVVSVPEQFQPELTSVHDFNSVKILVTQGQKVKEQTQNVFPTQHQFETLFTDMHVGSCKVNVLISDSEGRTVYTGTGTASIQSGKETVANITVAPASGTVTVEVDLPDEMNVQSGTVTMTHCLTQIDDPSQVTADLTINGEKATATFTDLYATIWGITVSLQDADQVEVGCGNTTVKVLPSQHINVNVPITRPVEHGALGGMLHFPSKAIMRESRSPLEITRQLPIVQVIIELKESLSEPMWSTLQKRAIYQTVLSLRSSVMKPDSLKI